MQADVNSLTCSNPTAANWGEGEELGVGGVQI